MKKTLYSFRYELGDVDPIIELNSIHIDLDRPDFTAQFERAYKKIFPSLDILILTPHDIKPIDEQKAEVRAFLQRKLIANQEIYDFTHGPLSRVFKEALTGWGAAYATKSFNALSVEYGMGDVGARSFCVVSSPRLDMAILNATEGGIKAEDYIRFVYNHEAFHCFSSSFQGGGDSHNKSEDIKIRESWSDVFAVLVHLKITDGDRRLPLWLESYRVRNRASAPLHDSSASIQEVLRLDFERDIKPRSMSELALLSFAITNAVSRTDNIPSITD